MLPPAVERAPLQRLYNPEPRAYSFPMPQAWSQTTIRAALLALQLTLSASVWADEPPPPPPASSVAPAHPAGATHVEVPCDAAAVDWAKGASKRTGVAITTVACPGGVVRLAVAGAGCDFEVTHDRGFQRTPDGAFGVSPIADLDWSTAPEPMKKGLAALLAALVQDPSLQMSSAAPRPSTRVGMFATGRNRLIVGAGSTLVVIAAAVALGWKRRKSRGAGAPPV